MSLGFPDLRHSLYDGAAGRLELRVIKIGVRVPIARQFFDLSDTLGIARFCKTYRDAELYFAVATRGPEHDGSLDNTVALPALFCDSDFKMFPDGEANARARLSAFPLPPSITIHSGGGLHNYWLLREPLDLPAEAPTASSYMRRLATAIGGDLSSAEPVHVLRIPGGLNHKYDPPRLVTIELFEPDRRYNLSDFDAWLPSVSESSSARYAGPAHATIGAGGRYAHLFRIGRSIWDKNPNREALVAALLGINSTQCDPPHPADYVSDIADQVIVGKHRQNYTGSGPELTKGGKPLFGAPPDPDPADAPDRPHRWTAASTIIEEPTPEVIIDGTLYADSITVLVGESAAGKTFVALDMAAAVADGSAWHGRPSHRGSVVYLAFEGHVGHRLRAIREAGQHDLDGLYIIHASDALSPVIEHNRSESPSRGEKDAIHDLDTLAADLVSTDSPPIRLIIVDTIRASLSGSEDNSEAASAYLRAIRRIMAHAPGAACLPIHHSGWQDGKESKTRERGSSAFRGNVDGTLYLAAGIYDPNRKEAALTLTCLKMRDGEQQPPLNMIRRQVPLDQRFDRWGHPVTTCIIIPDLTSPSEREATEKAAKREVEDTADRTLLLLISSRTDITSITGMQTTLRVSRDSISQSIGRLIDRGLLVAPTKQRAPYTVTEPGMVWLQITSSPE